MLVEGVSDRLGQSHERERFLYGPDRWACLQGVGQLGIAEATGEEHGDVRILLRDSARQFAPAEFWHSEITEHQIDVFCVGVEKSDRLIGVGVGDDTVAERRQDLLDRLGNGDFIVNDEDRL